MKLEKLFFATVLSGLAFTACVDNDDKSEWNDGSQPISFTSSIKGINTRAVDSKWTAGDKIGVFMKATSGDLASAIAVNKQHATDANGNVSAADADNALYYPTDGSSVDFIAYYPYTASLTGNVYKVNVADQSKPENIDLLYSNNATGFAKGTANKPQLQFAHQLSQIVFNITKDATVPSLNGLTVTFEGMNTTADFALANGTLSNVGAAAKIAAVVDETAATAKTIVLPAAALADVKVVFNLNGKAFTADYPQKELLTGRKYTHNVKLSDSNGQPVIVMDAATIEDWITVPGGDIDVDFGDGTDVPEPSEVVVLDESFNAGQGAFTIDNKDLGGMNFVWAHKVFESVGYMKASGYYNDTANACESWLVSPNVDLSKATKATLTFMHCDNNSKVDLAARQTVMTLWATEAATEQWEQIAIPTYGAGTDYIYVSSGDIDLSKYAGKSMKFAFKYVCNGDFSATWQIQNVKVVADAGEGGGTVDPDPEPDPTPGANLLTNPGFEDWTEKLPTAWNNDYNTGEIVKSTDIKHGGNNALRQTSSAETEKVQQEIAIEAGKTYKISYWFLDNDTKASSRYWCAMVGADGKAITDINSQIQQKDYSKDNAEWQHVEITFTAPANTVKMRYDVRTYKASATALGGYIYYDDFELTEVVK